MDESGSGQPRSGDKESAERHATPATPAAGPTRSGSPRRATPPTPPADEPTMVVRRLDLTGDDAAGDAPAHHEDGHAATDERPHRTDADGRKAETADARDRDTDDPETGPAHDPNTPLREAGSRRTATDPAPVADRPTPPGDGSQEADEPAEPPAPTTGATPHDADRPAPTPAPTPGPTSHDSAAERPEPPRPQSPDTPADSHASGPATGHRPATDHQPAADHRHTPNTHRHTPGGQGQPPRPPEPRGGLLMGRPFGVPVYVAPSWFLVAALITWVFGGQLDRVLPELGAARYLVSLFFAVAFYASVLVHELAHTVAALRFKLPVRRIQLQFFGGVSEIEKEAETPGREFILAFVGPLLSLVLAGVFYAAMQPVEPGTVPGVLLAGLMISNLIVAAFNLLPGLPLDGGRMLRAIVWKITGKPMAGTVAAAWVGRALAVSVLVGLPWLTQSGALGTDAVDNVGMDTVMDALLAAILAAIIWTGAGNSLRMARLREHLPELRARALTRRAVPVEGDTPLSEALRRANAAGARALVVVDADGNPHSLVREAAIVGVPEHRRPWVAVSGLAQELTEGMRVSAELAGEELLDALRGTPATEYLVVEETGEIYGVLSAADVERAFVKAMARPS
ncbi:site-2 protease family protein [Streptomyces sp. NPDC006385]|uniref:site-2 protease family protein n=1 Tax=Streptomyces sp. NPDC006385 TaxID=3156761 RepID=UPI0033BDD76F